MVHDFGMVWSARDWFASSIDGKPGGASLFHESQIHLACRVRGSRWYSLFCSYAINREEAVTPQRMVFRIFSRSTPLCLAIRRRMLLRVPTRIGLWSGTGSL